VTGHSVKAIHLNEARRLIESKLPIHVEEKEEDEKNREIM